VDKKLYLLNEKMDKLLHFQEELTGKLQRVDRGIADVGNGTKQLSAAPAAPGDTAGAGHKGLQVPDSAAQADVQSICSEVLNLMKAAQLDASKHKERLAKIEKRVDTLDKVITFVGEVLKNSKVVDFILKGIVPWKKGSLLEIPVEAKDKSEESGAKPKHVLSNRGTQTESKKPLEGIAVASKAESKAQPKDRTAQQQGAEGAGKPQSSKSCPQQRDIGVRASNQNNGLPSVHQDHAGSRSAPTGAREVGRAAGCPGQPAPQEPGRDGSGAGAASAASRGAVPCTPRGSDTGAEVTHTSKIGTVRFCQYYRNLWVWKLRDFSFPTKLQKPGWPHASISNVSCLLCRISISVHMTDTKEKIEMAKEGNVSDSRAKSPKVKSTPAGLKGVKQLPDKLKLHQSPENISSKPNTEVKGDNKQNELAPQTGKQQPFLSKPKPAEKAEEKSELKSQPVSPADDSPSPPAPFEHRIVSVKTAELTSSYSVCRHQVLGGGRFGQVHKCTEISTGLNLAAKIIKVKGAKEKEEVKNEINIMNQLNHVNLIQLYDAFEAKNNITLIMEYLDGGELFDRITDENYHLTELDAILFTKQICEGVHYLHQHYILHLDLKPENILCVNHTGNQIKIIDFGLARRYKPCEKLKVNFGTPEFLAPEVVNYDFVSFPTDMWSVGVITYMLLSGLSPFLGETDAETMNYVVNCSWDFDAEAFEQLSEDAKDFISRLLVKEKSCRMSATQCLKHEWLSNLPAKARQCKLRLKSQLLLQSYMAHRKWKKHFYVVAAANRLKRFQSTSVKLA
ncbi:MYLK3 kinase, partial [Copsychus sechellarum]|nr:MYLK3 kinase [Copsychus sechellarum]